MLNVMRKHAGSWMIKVILFAIVIVFVFWGVGSFRSRQASKVATVNGEIIGITEYQQAYNNLIDRYRQQFGTSLNDSMLKMLQVKRQVTEQLINRAILMQEAEKLGLRVSDDEVADSIKRMSVFQSNGRFDNRRYRAILTQVHLTPEAFEADQKSALLGEKLTRIVTGAANVSDMEAREWYNWQNAMVNIDYVLFSPSSYTDITPSADAIAAYFEAHKENYKTAPMRKARYVAFDPKAYTDQITVDEDEIVDYYDTHKNEFSDEKAAAAEGAGTKTLDQSRPTIVTALTEIKARNLAYDKAEQLYGSTYEKEDLIKNAKNAHLTVMETGAFTSRGPEALGSDREAFARAAFALNVDDISNVQEIGGRYYLIQVTEIIQAAVPKLETVQGRVTADLTKKMQADKARASADAMAADLKKGTSFADSAASRGLQIEQSGLIKRNATIPGIGTDPAISQAAFELSAANASSQQAVEGKAGFYLLHLLERKAPAADGFDAEKEKISKLLLQQKQRTVFQDWMMARRAESQVTIEKGYAE
ncbi:putative PpiC-type peptidyl-prolyl cis-trans isomerase [Desulfosarcina cetonica]|uniref:peptidylprolyl isomerase n=1 Tax=Desulfosarcina cetonica TaxID=90730 RepID=UPI0006D06E59|nr:peptidylprolyl isomerase [Desulfosarcina cetonica]VTR63972.1 putative PpiC-type peptidyl-prolyl cis-trans isomerase [Desulfosarcina cetonica]